MGKWAIRVQRAASPGARAARATVASVLLGAMGMVVASAALGLVANQISSRGIPVFPEAGSEAPAVELPPGARAISVEEACIAYEEGSALFLDARSPREYAAGHIPGALSLPPQEFEERFLDLVEDIEAAAKVIVYCSGGECTDSVELCERLQETTGRMLYVLPGGWEEWRRAGHPTKKGDGP